MLEILCAVAVVVIIALAVTFIREKRRAEKALREYRESRRRHWR